jgi:hypothetical protein
LALFGRRPPQRVEQFVMPASKNLHSSGLWAQGPFYGIVVEKAEHRMMEEL